MFCFFFVILGAKRWKVFCEGDFLFFLLAFAKKKGILIKWTCANKNVYLSALWFTDLKVCKSDCVLSINSDYSSPRRSAR